MTELTDPGPLEDGIGVTRKVIEALPPIDHEGEAVQAVVEGMIRAAELLQQDDVEDEDP